MRAFLICALLVPLAGSAQGVVRRSVTVPDQEILLPGYRGAAMTAAATLGYRNMPARACVVRGVQATLTTLSGGGAGNTVVNITDGTSTCVATWTCVATGAGYGIKVATLSGTCTFPAGAALSTSVATAGCTTTQPTFTTVLITGNWL